MKKGMIWAATAALTLFAGAALAENTLTMDDIRKANDFEAAFAAKETVGMTMVYSDENGEDITSLYAWMGRNASGDSMFVMEGDDGSVQILEGGRGYGFDDGEKQLYVDGFMGDQYNEVLNASVKLFELDQYESEEVKSVSQTDGRTTIETSCYELGTSYKLTTVVETDTLRVLTQQCEAVPEDGCATVNWHSSYTYGEAYPMDETFTTLWNEPLHTLTIVDKSEGKQNETTQFSASVGVDFTVYLPQGYSTFYMDEACTQPYVKSAEDIQKDITLYTKADES